MPRRSPYFRETDLDLASDAIVEVEELAQQSTDADHRADLERGAVVLSELLWRERQKRDRAKRSHTRKSTRPSVRARSY